jgi:hypothetical protein
VYQVMRLPSAFAPGVGGADGVRLIEALIFWRRIAITAANPPRSWFDAPCACVAPISPFVSPKILKTPSQPIRPIIGRDYRGRDLVLKATGSLTTAPVPKRDTGRSLTARRAPGHRGVVPT